MWLVVLRTLAVYGGSAALFLILAHRWVAPVRTRVALLLALAPLLFTGKAMLTGGVFAPIDILYNAEPFGARRAQLGIGPDKAPTLGDVAYQGIPWRMAVRAAIRRGELPLWNPHILAGEPLLAVQQPAVLHPATWIGFLLPLPQAWTFEMALRIFLALLCAYLFLREIGCGEAAALLGAFGWAFCDYMVFFLGYPLSPAAAPLPLLLLGMRRIARESDRRAVTIAVVALLLMVTSGHPETLLHAAAGAGPYFLFELARTARGARLRAFLLALFAGIVALGLSAVLLLPLAEALPHTVEHALRTSWYANQPRALEWEAVLQRLGPQVIPYGYGAPGHGRQMAGFLEPAAYAGSLLLPLALTGLFSRNRERWFLLGMLVFGLAVSTKTPAADAITAIPLFDIALNERLIFWTAFSLCALAALGANRLAEGGGGETFVVGAAASTLGLTLLFFRMRPQMAGLEMPPGYMRERFLLQVIPLLASIGIVAILARRRRLAAAVVALTAVFVAARTLEAGRLYPTISASAFYPPFEALSRIPRGEPYRVVGLQRVLIPNAATLYGLEDVRGYEAMTFLPLWQTYPLWCVPQAVWYNRVDDPTRPFLSFLNVRWVLAPREWTPPAGWAVLADGDDVRLFENPSVLPRAFVPRLYRQEDDPARRLELLKTVDDFGERGVSGEASGAEWISNGGAKVSIASYGAQSMELDVDAREETLVGTSVTAWPGWKAKLNGRPLAAVSYNHAFLGFRVPAGQHRIVLRYIPDGFRFGAAISLTTLVLALWLLFRRGRHRLGQNPM